MARQKLEILKKVKARTARKKMRARKARKEPKHVRQVKN